MARGIIGSCAPAVWMCEGQNVQLVCNPPSITPPSMPGNNPSAPTDPPRPQPHANLGHCIPGDGVERTVYPSIQTGQVPWGVWVNKNADQMYSSINFRHNNADRHEVEEHTLTYIPGRTAPRRDLTRQWVVPVAVRGVAVFEGTDNNWLFIGTTGGIYVTSLAGAPNPGAAVVTTTLTNDNRAFTTQVEDIKIIGNNLWAIDSGHIFTTRILDITGSTPQTVTARSIGRSATNAHGLDTDCVHVWAVADDGEARAYRVSDGFRVESKDYTIQTTGAAEIGGVARSFNVLYAGTTGTLTEVRRFRLTGTT